MFTPSSRTSAAPSAGDPPRRSSGSRSAPLQFSDIAARARAPRARPGSGRCAGWSVPGASREFARPRTRDGVQATRSGDRGSDTRRPDALARYIPLIVTFVAAPSTRRTAALGARLREPRLPFLMAPMMLTLLANAPPVRLTGMPPMVAHGHRLLATDTRFLPVPPKPTSAPFTLRIDPPARLTSGPLSTDSVLPLVRLKRSPVTRSKLPPATLRAAPLAIVSVLRSSFTSEPRLVTLA